MTDEPPPRTLDDHLAHSGLPSQEQLRVYYEAVGRLAMACGRAEQMTGVLIGALLDDNNTGHALASVLGTASKGLDALLILVHRYRDEAVHRRATSLAQTLRELYGYRNGIVHASLHLDRNGIATSMRHRGGWRACLQGVPPVVYRDPEEIRPGV